MSEILRKLMPIGIASSLLVPSLAFAQNLNYVSNAIKAGNTTLDNLVPVLIGIALILFFWGVVKYVTAGDDPEKKKAGRGFMVWGIIALFVIVALWGLVILVQEITGLDESSNSINVPDVILKP